MQTLDPSQPLLTVAEAATVLRVGSAAVYSHVRTGKLRALRIGSGPRPRLRIPSSEVDRLLQDPAAVAPSLADRTTPARAQGTAMRQSRPARAGGDTTPTK